MLQHGIYDKPNLRMMVEGMLYRMRVGCPWRVLPYCKVALEFIGKLPRADYIIADKGYDSEELRTLIRNKSSIPIIPRKNNSTIGNAGMDLYKYNFRSIATRYDKLKRNYASMLAMGCGFLWLPM